MSTLWVLHCTRDIFCLALLDPLWKLKYLISQLDQLESQLRQKTRVLEKMSGMETDQKVAMETLKESLAAANRDVMQKNHEVCTCIKPPVVCDTSVVLGVWPSLAGNEQCIVMDRGFGLCVRWQVRLWRLAFVKGLEAWENTGPRFNSDPRTSDRLKLSF